jgi:kynureninase
MPLDTSEAHALRLDLEDPLSRFRRRFFLPADAIYLDGNSMGLLSHDAERSLLRALDDWKTLGIRGWLEAESPWFYFAEKIGARAARLVGAGPDEVVLTGTTTGNIHSLVATFYDPADGRTRILADVLDFPTDIFALRGQLRLRGADPGRDLVLAPSADGRTLDEAALIEAMTDDVQLVFLPSVLYRSGQLLQLERLTRAAHERGKLIGFDCSHSVGAVPHLLDEWDVDFAVWCSYKYLNAGPGSSAFLYLNRRHFAREPLLTGWFGCVKEKQFEMALDFEHQRSAGGWQISSPGILGSAALEGSLAVTLEAGMERVREKSLRLTSYLIELVDELLAAPPYAFTVGTPREPARRGGHVALEREEDAYRISVALRQRGVIPDFRAPNIIRVAPIALYNTYHEVWQLAQHLREIVDNKEYEAVPRVRSPIT